MKIYLKETLKARGIKQADLAKLVGVSPGYISELVAGKKTPSIETLNRILSATGASAAELYGESETSNKLDAELADPAPSGFSEPTAAPFSPKNATTTNRAIKDLFPKTKHITTYTLSQSIPGFLLSSDDILIIELQGTPKDGDLVIANLVDMDTGEAKTVARRKFSDWLIPADMKIPANNTNTENPSCSILGIISGSIRNATH
ncbi:helix-turn-helix domain-containing protein [Shimia thalassica]|uniref:helix-turn-helix domain-containing protein n=1 Tax=Shimia thalassica TaxID=1715693 RepID=UPI0026E23A43|nr:LexA family transcriptional regulator [Shimia thalassica]MDO6483073.1 helix-turn-helix domain-containing protein [Shimia thalassica]